jgi:outer membrane protein assembly factor BamB
MKQALLAAMVLGPARLPLASAGDAVWPQWRGPQRNGTISAAPWPERLDEASLKRLWRVEIAEGYAGPVVGPERVYTVETAGRKTEIVRAFDRRSGTQLWAAQWAGAMTVPFFASRNGSWVRSTPALDGGFLYVAGMREVLVRLDATSGAEKWRVDFPDRYTTQLPSFGFVCSPLVVGDHVYVQAGASFLKLEKTSGRTVWRTLTDAGGMWGSAFSSPVLATIGGTQQLLVQTRNLLAGVDPVAGTVLWQHPVKAFRGMNILSPTVLGDEVFTSSYGGGSFLYAVKRTQSGFSVDQAWANRKIEGYMSTPVVIDGHIYLFGRNRRFFCLDVTTRKERWRSEEKFGRYCSLVANGSMILGLDQRGELLLIRADPARFTLVDRRSVADSETWGHLAVAGDQLFVRELKALAAFRWKAPAPR